MSEFEIIIKFSDKKVPLKVTEETLVSKVKADLSTLLEIPAERQRLIYGGRVLKDDQALGSYNIKEGHSVHLVKGAVPNSGNVASTTGSGSNNTSYGNINSSENSGIPSNIAAGTGAGNPLAALTGAQFAGHGINPNTFGAEFGLGQTPNQDDLINMMLQPGFRESMDAMLSNPRMLDHLLGSNPAFQEMGPQLRQIMQNEHVRRMMTDPNVLQGMMEMQRAMNPQVTESFPAPGSVNNSDTNRTENASNSGTTNIPTNLFGMNITNFMQALEGSGGLASRGFSTTGATDTISTELEDNRSPEDRYESQLRQLNELGFFDFDRNVRALRRAGGNVQGAIEALLDGSV